jgi:protein SCO1/2
LIADLDRAAASLPTSLNAANDQPSQERRDSEQASLSQVSAARRTFPDVTLVNQDGEKMQFYSDLLKGKVVVISSFVTSCPAITRTVAKIQNWLGDRLGKQVYLISISANPAEDPPSQLKSFADQFKAKPGWDFLTGDRDTVNLTLRRLGQYEEKKGEHLNSLIIGNDRTGLWIKTFGLTKAEELVKLIERVLMTTSRS